MSTTLNNIALNTANEVNNTVNNSVKTLKEYRQGVSCPKGLKVNFQENADLSALVNNAYVVYFELSERMLAFSKSSKVLVDSIDKLNAKTVKGQTLTAAEQARLKSDTAMLAELRSKYSVYRSINRKAEAALFSDIEGIAKGYAKDVENKTYSYPNFNKAMGEFFGKYSIAYKGALKDFFMTVACNLREAGAKKIVTKNSFFEGEKETVVNRKVLKALVDIAICKNAVTFKRIEESAVDFFENYADIKDIKVVAERPSTIEEYTKLFEEVGVDMTGLKLKADYEKAFDKNANKMFAYVA